MFLNTKDILDLTELSSEDIFNLLSLAQKLKKEGKNFKRNDLDGKSVGLIFNKPSTRTRVSFEIGAGQLGANCIYLSASDLQLNRGESIEDTAKVLSSYLDAIVLRTHFHDEAAELAKHAKISVINALTDLHHPCQSLADLLTIQENKNRLKDLKLAYFGDGNNVCNSLIIACAKVGINIAIATPQGFEPEEEIVALGNKIAVNNLKIEVTNDPVEAARNADILYTDVWVSMGEEDKSLANFKPYQLNSKLFSYSKNDAIIMHCLPAHRGEEISAELLDSSNSVIFQQAENRLYAQKALMIGLLSNVNIDKL